MPLTEAYPHKLTGSPQLVIVTGGQSGVDRAALDAAVELAIPYGGFCPRGGWAEDFPEPPGLLAHYPLLKETLRADPAQRTEWNVCDADAVLIVVDDSGIAASQGTALARTLAERYGKPLFVLALADDEGRARVARWLDEMLSGRAPGEPLRLGIGGPRESEARGIYARTLAVLRELLRGR
jgi:Circularly permutated YpsA SLOG family